MKPARSEPDRCGRAGGGAAAGTHCLPVRAPMWNAGVEHALSMVLFGTLGSAKTRSWRYSFGSLVPFAAQRRNER